MFSIYVNILDPVPDSTIANIIGSTIIVFNYIFVYYTLGLYVFPRAWGKNKIKLFLLLLGTFCIYIAIDYPNYYYIIPSLQGSTHFDDKHVYSFFATMTVVFIIIAFISFSFYSGKLKIHQLKNQNNKAKTLIIKEMSFLKNQFNTHIAFNFLNFCYSHIHKSSPKVADSIEIFSDMLRYTLKTKADIPVPLEDEINYIRSFISLNKQIKSHVYIDFKCQGDTSSYEIIPLIFITFLMIIFKYIHNVPVNDHLQLLLVSKHENITFKIRTNLFNDNKTGNIHEEMNNLKQLLEQYYKNNYTLHNRFEKNIYAGEIVLKV